MTLEEAKNELEKFVKLKTAMRPAFLDVILKAEPVIRCKDCFFCGEIDENGWHWCQNSGAGMPKDGFCSFAERKGWNWGR